jgi:cytochrome c oxidase subunit 3
VSVISPPLAADRRPPLLVVGTIVWLASELMFFAGLFASYFTIRAANLARWPGPGIKLATGRDAAFTLVLVASSYTMQQAVQRIRLGRRPQAIRWILATAALGAVFLTNQAVEWVQVPFRPSTTAYGSLFFIMTGFHGLHVLLGLFAMGGLVLRLASGRRPDPGADPATEVVAYYWHFVDVVWIGLFITLFFIR